MVFYKKIYLFHKGHVVCLFIFSSSLMNPPLQTSNIYLELGTLHLRTTMMADGELFGGLLRSTGRDGTESTATVTNSLDVLDESVIRNNSVAYSDSVARDYSGTPSNPVGRNDLSIRNDAAVVKTSSNFARTNLASVDLEVSLPDIPDSIPETGFDNTYLYSSEVTPIFQPEILSTSSSMRQEENNLCKCTVAGCGKAFPKEAGLRYALSRPFAHCSHPYPLRTALITYSIHVDLCHPASPEMCDQKLIALLEAFGCNKLKTAQDYDHLTQIYSLWLLSTGQSVVDAMTNGVIFADFRNRVRDIQKNTKEAKKNTLIQVSSEVLLQHQPLGLPTSPERNNDSIESLDESLAEAPAQPEHSASLFRLNYQDHGTHISRNSLGPGYVNKGTQAELYDPHFSLTRGRSQHRRSARIVEGEPAEYRANGSTYPPDSHIASLVSPEPPPSRRPRSSSRFTTSNESRAAYIPPQRYPELRPTFRNPGMQPFNSESSKRKRYEDEMPCNVKSKKEGLDQDCVDLIEWNVMVKQYKNHFKEISDEKQRGVDQVAQAFRKTIWEIYWIFGLDVVFSRKCLTKLISIGKERPDITVYDVFQKAQEKRKIRVINEGNRSRSIFTLADITKTHQFFCPDVEPDRSSQGLSKENRFDSEEPENFRGGPRRSFHERPTGYDASFDSRSEINPARHPVPRRGPKIREDEVMSCDDYVDRNEDPERLQDNESAQIKKKRSQVNEEDQFSKKRPQASDDHYSHHRHRSSSKSEHGSLPVTSRWSSLSRPARTSSAAKHQYREVSEDEGGGVKLASRKFSSHASSEELAAQTQFDITPFRKTIIAPEAPAAPVSRASSVVSEKRLPLDDPVSSLHRKGMYERQSQHQVVNNAPDTQNTPQERPYRYLLRKNPIVRGDHLVQTRHTPKERSKRALQDGMFNVRAALAAGDREKSKLSSSTSGANSSREIVPFSQRIRKHRPSYQAPAPSSALNNQPESFSLSQQTASRQEKQARVETESPTVNPRRVAAVDAGRQKPGDPYLCFSSETGARSSSSRHPSAHGSEHSSPRGRDDATDDSMNGEPVRALEEPEKKRRRVSGNDQEKRLPKAQSYTSSMVSEDEDEDANGGKRFNFHG